MQMNKGDAANYLQKLSEAEIKSLFIKLVAFAEFRLRFAGEDGEMAEDFVQEAIRKAIDITADSHRVWNLDVNPTFEGFIKGAISSEISNYFKLQRTQGKTDVNKNSEYDFFKTLVGEIKTDGNLTANEFRDFIFDKLVEYEPELAELLFFQDEGYEVNELIKVMGYNRREDVYNARKRLIRVCKKIIDEYNGGEGHG